MQSKATTPAAYIKELPAERKKPISDIRSAIRKNLPKGFKEVMGYGMLCYVVPHSLYPEGYHCNPEQPLPFISLASQKNHIALYHMGLYANSKLTKWFTENFKKRSKVKLDMGKCCIRFKKPEDIPFELIGELSSKITPEEWIAYYTSAIKKK